MCVHVRAEGYGGLDVCAWVHCMMGARHDMTMPPTTKNKNKNSAAHSDSYNSISTCARSCASTHSGCSSRLLWAYAR